MAVVPSKPEGLSLREHFTAIRIGSKHGKRGKLTEEFVERVLVSVRYHGMPAKNAMLAAGAPLRTIQFWWDQAGRGVRKYLEFFELLNQAAAAWQEETLSVAMLAARGDRVRIKVQVRNAKGDLEDSEVMAPDKPDAKMLQWLLERSDPDQFHLPTRTVVMGHDGGSVKVDVRSALVSKLERLAETTNKAQEAARLDGERQRGEASLGEGVQLEGVPLLVARTDATAEFETDDGPESSRTTGSEE